MSVEAVLICLLSTCLLVGNPVSCDFLSMANIVSRQYSRILLRCIALLLIPLVCLDLKLGQVNISWQDLLHVLWSGDAHSGLLSQVIWQLRLPHVLSVLLAGFTLSASGAVMQGLFRNPLADPALLGVATGGQCFIVMGWLLGLGSWWALSLWVPIAALFGGLLSVFMLYQLSLRIRYVGIGGLLLAGVALSTFFAALCSILILQLDNMSLRQLLLWSFGGVVQTDWHLLGIAVLLAGIGFFILTFQAKRLDILSLGEQEARYAGVNLSGLKRQCIIGVALLVAAAVTLVGPIAFIGLIVPHVVRLVRGPAHRPLIWSSGVLGAAILILTDCLSRAQITTTLLPLGILVAAYGAPLFIVLLLKHAKVRAVC